MVIQFNRLFDYFSKTYVAMLIFTEINVDDLLSGSDYQPSRQYEARELQRILGQMEQEATKSQGAGASGENLDEMSGGRVGNT